MRKLPKPNADVDFPAYCLAFYEVSVEEEARLAVNSFMAFGECISAQAPDGVAASFLHEALMHCAAISRYFWPSRTASFSKQRGALLRKRYNMSDASPLANRALRNALEHFDERLDEWILGNPVGPILASPVLADHCIGDDGFGHIFKLIDPENDIFVVLGKKFEFGPLGREVSRILTSEVDRSGLR